MDTTAENWPGPMTGWPQVHRLAHRWARHAIRREAQREAYRDAPSDQANADVPRERSQGRRHHRDRGGRGFGDPMGFGGPPFMGPWRGGGRPRPRRGDVRLAVLTLLAEQPMHGYQIITEMASRSGGVWRPSPGSVYPILQQLQDELLVSLSEEDGRRTFTLTEAGRAEVARASAGRRAPWDDMADEADDGRGRLRSQVGQLIAAVTQVATAGNDEQVATAEKVLSEARRSLYRLLADDDPGAQT